MADATFTPLVKKVLFKTVAKCMGKSLYSLS